MHRQMSEIGQKMLIWKYHLKSSIFRIYLVYSVGSIRLSYAKKTPLFGCIQPYSILFVFGRRIWLPNIRSWRTLTVRVTYLIYRLKQITLACIGTILVKLTQRSKSDIQSEKTVISTLSQNIAISIILILRIGNAQSIMSVFTPTYAPFSSIA